MHCSKCGAENGDGPGVCAGCGAALEGADSGAEAAPGGRPGNAQTAAAAPRKKKNRTAVIAAALALAVIAFVLIYMNTGQRLVLKEISRGEKSLSAGDFEAAVSAFGKAARRAPGNEAAQEGLAKAYAGLVSAYIAGGETARADEILKEAYPGAASCSPLDFMEEQQKEALYSHYGLKVSGHVLEGWAGEEPGLFLPSYLGITEIGYNAFALNETLESVTIPEGVTVIGEAAFISCTALSSATIPEGVTVIGESAFTGCESLTSVTLPESVTVIGESAFLGCTGLKSVTLPENLAEIGNLVFAETGIEEPVLANHDTILCYVPADLDEYEIPDTVTAINGAFYYCAGLKSVTIPKSVTDIGYYSFAHCRRLKTVELPQSVTAVGEGAFRDCDRLISITIPESVTVIGEKAFSGCDRLTIHGSEGSLAQSYAEENGISFTAQDAGEYTAFLPRK